MQNTAQNTANSPRLLRLYRSSLGKKLLTGLTGLALSLFVLVHMVGNLTLFAGRDAYNAYAHHLENWGILLYALEAILLVSVLVHAAIGFQIFVGRLRARPQLYDQYVSLGRPSLQSVSSRTMLLTGILLAAFLVSHLLRFKFGVQYTTQIHGETGRDLARLVIERFQNLAPTLGYTAILGLLGLHLRHGLWSALQSLGAMSDGLRPVLYMASTVLAAAIAIGYIGLPWAIYLGLVN